MHMHNRTDIQAGWSDILKLVSDLGFRRLGISTLFNGEVTVCFDSSIGSHAINIFFDESKQMYYMTEFTNNEEKDKRPLTQSMLRFIPTHIQIAHRSLGVTQ